DQDNMTFFYNEYVGESMSDFFSSEEHAKRTIASAACHSGMIDGIKSIDSDAQCVINENRVSFGYYKFLEYMNVNYDIVGYNFYGEEFNGNYLGFNLNNE